MFGGNTFGQLGLGVKPVACKPASVRGQSLNFIPSSHFAVHVIDIDDTFIYRDIYIYRSFITCLQKVLTDQ